MSNHFSILDYTDFLNHYKNKINILESGCHEWLGSSSGGYATIKLAQKTIRVSRYIYFLYYGGFDDSLLVCHTCDNPACVNPRHFFLGTNKDNVDDMLQKGRNNQSKGSKHWMHKLTEQDVINIIIRVRNGELQKELATEYNLNKSTVSEIVNRKTWTHVDI